MLLILHDHGHVPDIFKNFTAFKSYFNGVAVCSASSDPVWGKNAIPRFWRVSINIPLAVVQHCHHCQHGDMLPLLSAAHCCGVAALQLRGTKYQVLSDGDVQQPALRPGPRHHSLLCHITGCSGYWLSWYLGPELLFVLAAVKPVVLTFCWF